MKKQIKKFEKVQIAKTELKSIKGGQGAYSQTGYVISTATCN